jgi:hypothetical protein
MQQKPKLLDQVRGVARARRLSQKTEEGYQKFYQAIYFVSRKTASEK